MMYISSGGVGGEKSVFFGGDEWLKAAHEANIEIPTGCLGGSCGACEIEINGEVIRSCIEKVPDRKEIRVELFNDPYWQ